jgi:hypothetical protein
MISRCAYDVIYSPHSPIALVTVELRNNVISVPPIRFSAVLDTGADISAVPRHIVAKNPGWFAMSYLTVEDMTGKARDIDAVFLQKVDIEFKCPKKGGDGISGVLEMSQMLVLPDGIIGRDILGKYDVQFFGREKLFSVHIP